MNAGRLIRIVLLAGISGAIYGICDLVFSWNPLAAAPYVAHAHEAVFRSSPRLDVGFLAELVNGWIAALSYLVVGRALTGPAWRRGMIFGLGIWGFWVISGTFTASVWLAIPWSVSGANVIAGLPKCLAIGAGVAIVAKKLKLVD